MVISVARQGFKIKSTGRSREGLSLMYLEEKLHYFGCRFETFPSKMCRICLKDEKFYRT